jgi:hypothetical protein
MNTNEFEVEAVYKMDGDLFCIYHRATMRAMLFVCESENEK